jgi:hypothetical protein
MKMKKRAGGRVAARSPYSPKVETIESLPRDGYDEWYVFETDRDLGISHLEENVFEMALKEGHVAVFVNYGGFSLAKADDFADLFWRQMEWIHAESYIADGHLFNFASSNKKAFDLVRDALKSTT